MEQSLTEEDELLSRKNHSTNYKIFLLVNLTTSPLSTLQRAYIPALILSQLYFDNVQSPESFILRLRSVGSFFSILLMPLLLFFKPVLLLRFIIVLIAICSMSFVLSLIPHASKWITASSYVGMISFTSLYEACLSSIIPVLIRQGENSKDVSGRSMVFSDVGALSVLLVGYLFASLGIDLTFCVFSAGLIVFCMSFKLNKLGDGEIRKLQWRTTVLKLCIAWSLWNCGMVNFMMIVNMRFRKMYLDRDGVYAAFMIWSFVCAALGTLCWMKVGSADRRWVYGLSIFTMLIYMYVILGVFSWNQFGLKYGIEFWVVECLFIATSSSFRSLNRAVYSEKLPKGEESQFFGLEILIGTTINWIIGWVSSIIKHKYEKDGYVIVLSLLVNLTSLVVYSQWDLKTG